MPSALSVNGYIFFEKGNILFKKFSFYVLEIYLMFFHTIRIPELDCVQMAVGLPPVTAAPYLIAKSFW
jgi:hypothetical protein